MSERYTNLVQVLRSSVAEHGTKDLFGTKKDGRWQWISYRRFAERVDAFRGGLARLGVGAEDTVAIISGNRVEWAVAAYATYGLRAQVCAMYESQSEKEWRYILEDSGAKVLFVSTYPIYEAARDWAGKVGRLERVFSMALPEEDEASFLAVEAAGRAHPQPAAEPTAEDVCCFIYTSGTTGKPKGVILTHSNIASNLNAVAEMFPFDERDVSVSFLPWAHSFGHTCELHALIARGAAIAIAESIDKLVDNFAEVKPTILFAVPRIFNRIYDGLHKKMAEAGGVTKALFDAALANAERRKQLAARGETSTWVELKHKLFDRLVFAKVRSRFGGRLRFAVSGGAALAPEVGDFIDKLGIFVCEGYGLTETSPIATSNRPGSRKLGSVGQAVPGVEITIDTSVVDHEDARDGEIIIRGPNVMRGYHGLDAETRAVMREDGGFRTGDLGRLDEDGFLYITGRLKEQYKLENGKYVVPAPLEDLLQLSPFIAQAYIHGENAPRNVALLVPDRAALEKWAAQEGVAGGYPELLEDPRVHELFAREVEAHSRDFKGYEKIARFHLLGEEMSVANGMLTPKLSIRRNVVKERYGEALAALYAAPSGEA